MCITPTYNFQNRFHLTHQSLDRFDSSILSIHSNVFSFDILTVFTHLDVFVKIFTTIQSYIISQNEKLQQILYVQTIMLCVSRRGL